MFPAPQQPLLQLTTRPPPPPASVRHMQKADVSEAATRLRAIIDPSILDDVPACNLANSDPNVVEPSCPDGSESVQDPETGAYRCMQDCSVLNKPRYNLAYQPSADGIKCLPVCPSGHFQAAVDGDSVTCALCGTGFAYSAAKGLCLQKCGAGDMQDLPVAYDALSPPRCSAACPRLFSKQKSYNACANTAGRTTARANAVRATMPPRKRQLAAVPRPEADMSCPDGSTAMDDENGVTSCYSCDDGQVLTQDGMGYAKCAADTCPTQGYNRCGIYCWHDMLADGIGFWQEDYCAAFLDSLASCMPDCASLKKKK
ncbi:hypothetical protein ABPG75_001990 [Micractinium tetrahymenae]